MKGVRLRLSRVLVAVFGSFVLIGSSGAAALYFGASDLFGPSYEAVNGLECTTMQVVKIKQDQHFWVRKYVFTDGGDGPSRLKTALRVASAVEATEKADLVQVTVLDKAGPTQRATMRGRAIGAQVVYIPDASKAPDASDAKYSAFYVEGGPSKSGEFFGLRIDPPLEDVERLAASLTDKADCLSPVDATAAAHGDASGEHGSKAPAEKGHAAPAEHEGASPSGHGDAPTAHGESPATPEAATGAESGGLISSLTGMLFGTKIAAASAVEEGGAAQSTEVADHSVPSTEHTAVAEQPGLFDRMKSMVFGSEAPKVVDNGAPAAVSGGQIGDHLNDGAQKPYDGIDPMKVAAPTVAANSASAEKSPNMVTGAQE